MAKIKSFDITKQMVYRGAEGENPLVYSTSQKNRRTIPVYSGTR